MATEMAMKNAGALHAEPAVRQDAAALADLIMIAGEGLPRLIWNGMREPGESVMDVGRRRAERETGGFSYRNAMVVRDRGRVVSALVSYAITEPALDKEIAASPPVFQPLIALENRLTPSWYINVLATHESHRRRGAAGLLLRDAECGAKRSGFRTLSLITGDRNPARSLYEAFGFREVHREGIRKDGWENDSDFWVAYTKELDM